jgi:hypothetical protein
LVRRVHGARADWRRAAAITTVSDRQDVNVLPVSLSSDRISKTNSEQQAPLRRNLLCLPFAYNECSGP